MFDLSQLRCFVAAAEELHFGRAAQRLNMTQSPLSRQIQLLERILDVMLLERTSRQVRLTPAGSAFLIEARRILRLAESAALSARRVARGDAGRVVIGFTAVSGYDLMPRIVAQAIARLPNIALELREMVTSEQVDALVTGLIDVAFVRPPIDRHEFESVCVLREPLIAALPAGDPRQARGVLVPADFDGLPLIMYARQGAGYFHEMLLKLFADAGAEPDYVQHVTQIHSMLGLVRAGLAAAIVPQAATSLHMTDVQFRTIQTEPENPVELVMAWRRDNSNPALAPMRQLCLDTLG
ncbi:LysR substrate-binding domain-containing protein [Sphingomonas sp. PsM26]|uniref:LysR family transcriptional regulator n=1 Tax=Sphingomonas aurantiaca TaxID=185949 RepID=A0A2T5GH15_9SPHN|nr:LysR substrate-binding domain-containing protein [Sphingomonas aurantiaca]MDN4633881.1 LysR substrate-binding domain-containing protein [Sphingomonas sp. PsM26]PTQ58626.1 LysR family transcriptional regulator [Sphingomonas aurantiaca]RZM34124.1 MAG: LysR family transcriptional regulator [Sphingomonas sp.]